MGVTLTDLVTVPSTPESLNTQTSGEIFIEMTREAARHADTEEAELLAIKDDENQEGEGEKTPLDDDEDRKNPQYIPKKGTFYEHDDRTAGGDEEADEAESAEEETLEEKEKKEVVKKKVWKENDSWCHDKFDPGDQEPKSKDELVASYGYDIRTEEGPPRARRRRRYGRGPNKYTRNWEDLDAYGKPIVSRGARGGSRGRGRPHNINSEEDFPSLGQNGNYRPHKDEYRSNGRSEEPQTKSPDHTNGHGRQFNSNSSDTRYTRSGSYQDDYQREPQTRGRENRGSSRGNFHPRRNEDWSSPSGDSPRGDSSPRGGSPGRGSPQRGGSPRGGPSHRGSSGRGGPPQRGGGPPRGGYRGSGPPRGGPSYRGSGPPRGGPSYRGSAPPRGGPSPRGGVSSRGTPSRGRGERGGVSNRNQYRGNTNSFDQDSRISEEFDQLQIAPRNEGGDQNRSRGASHRHGSPKGFRKPSMQTAPESAQSKTKRYSTQRQRPNQDQSYQQHSEQYHEHDLPPKHGDQFVPHNATTNMMPVVTQQSHIIGAAPMGGPAPAIGATPPVAANAFIPPEGIINYVAPPALVGAHPQAYQVPPFQTFPPVSQQVPTEVYRNGVTYYYTENQPQSRANALLLKRPKAAIPIRPPSEKELAAEKEQTASSQELELSQKEYSVDNIDENISCQDHGDQSASEIMEEPVPNAAQGQVANITEDPLPSATKEPAPQTTEEPVSQVTKELAPPATEEPVSQVSEEPLPKATEESVSQVSEEPLPQATEEPLPKATEEPVSQVSEEPLPKTTEEPISQLTEEPLPNVSEEPIPTVTDEPNNSRVMEEPEPSTPETIEVNEEKKELELSSVSEATEESKSAHTSIEPTPEVKQSVPANTEDKTNESEC